MKVFGKFTDAAPGSPPPGMYVPIFFPQMGLVGTRTRDGRLIDAESFETLTLPRSIKLKTIDAPGHDGAEVSGRLDEVTLGDDGVVSGKGWLNADPTGKRSAFLVKNESLRGNSMDLAVAQEDVSIDVFETDDGAMVMHADMKNVRLKGTTLLTEPAFDDAAAVIPDGWDVEGFDVAETEAIVAALAYAEAEDDTEPAFAFSVLTERPKFSAEPFQEPKGTELHPVYVDEGDHVYGYVAGWHTPHLNVAGIVPPRSQSNYAYYANKGVLTTDGMLSTGPIVLGLNHANEKLLWRDAIDHYANTDAAWADVCIGENELGIWVAGIVRPGTSAEKVHAGRASALSGDWRRIGGRMEFVANLSVNAPGFPTPKPRTFGHELDFPLTLLGAGALPAPGVSTRLAVAEPDPNIKYLAERFATEEARALVDSWGGEV